MTHCAKSVRIPSFAGLYFPAFTLNTERYSVSLCIQPECWKIRAWKTRNTDTFHAVIFFVRLTKFLFGKRTLRENCPNTEFFLVHIFSHLDWIRRDTPYLFVSSPNAGKYGPEKTPYLETFHAVRVFRTTYHNNS